ncbi:hypothetical protein Kpho02_36100 [Kitasatospora phosalacinea]|uniref:NodB homology domain-containing protein n=1 Tax=Kitasatospora phosalacinea TaxID=2065 RepID=A0A9W6V147_9ACTN|nr:polysaccharide deacetylase family protein [Kitasatospora phosalacinea]GLW71311.1 hypothetical protein Kpho02_36100 [Kitasatospora phosalacinea]
MSFAPTSRTLSRRSALQLAGSGALSAVGTSLLAACGSSEAPGGPTPPASGSASPGTAGAEFPVPKEPAVTPGGLTPSTRRATWSLQFQSGHGFKATGAGTKSSEPDDSKVFLTGSQSARTSTDGSGRQSSLRRAGMPKIDLTGKMLRLTLRVENTDHLRKMALYVGSSDLANYYLWQFHTHSSTSANFVQSGEWVVITLQWSDVTEAAGSYKVSKFGVPTVTSGFTDLSLAVYDDAKGPVTYWVQSIEAVPDTRTTFPRGAVSITFDDSRSSVYDLALPAMKARGLTGTMFNIAESAGTPGYLTLDQMKSLQQAGWEMGGHAFANDAHTVGYNQLTAKQVDADLGKLRDWMDSNGFDSRNFAYPHGSFQQTTDGVPVDLIAGRHFSTARSIVYETIESFTPAMPYRLRAITGINDGTGIGGSALADLTAPGGRLDRCVRNGDWLILCFHELVESDPTASTQITREGFAAAMSAIAASGAPVVTVSEAMKHYS